MANTTAQTGYAPVNGLNVYHVIHGSGGHPLLLLPILPAFLDAPMPDAK